MRKLLKTEKVFIVLLVTITILTVFSALWSDPPIEEAIIGKWQVVDGTGIAEFSKGLGFTYYDKEAASTLEGVTFKLGDKVSLVGSYKFLDSNRIERHYLYYKDESIIGGIVGKYQGLDITQVVEISITKNDRDELIMKAKIIDKEGQVGQVEKYKKIK